MLYVPVNGKSIANDGVGSFLLPKVMAWTPLLYTASVVPKWKLRATT
jgi:hypothetical protein